MAESRIINIKQIEPNKGQIEGLPKNPRLIKDNKFDLLKKSIREDPEMMELREILVIEHQGKFIIIGGNMRYHACRELGHTEMPCKIIPPGTSIDKLKRYTIKDNASFGEWDMDMLANEWELPELLDWGLDMPKISIEDGEEDNSTQIAQIKLTITHSDLEVLDTLKDELEQRGYKCKL